MNLKEFWNTYKGAIIGVIIAIVILITRLHLLTKCSISKIKKGSKMSRTAVREQTFKLIYSLEIQKQENLDDAIRVIFRGK